MPINICLKVFCFVKFVFRFNKKSFLLKALQFSVSGQCIQDGNEGLQINAPNSMMAWA